MDYKKLINKLKKDDSIECVMEVLQCFLEETEKTLEEAGVLDFSEFSFVDWIQDKHADLISDDLDLTQSSEEIFDSITNNDDELMIELYSEYLFEGNKISNLIDILEDLSYISEENEDSESFDVYDEYYDDYN